MPRSRALLVVALVIAVLAAVVVTADPSTHLRTTAEDQPAAEAADDVGTAPVLDAMTQPQPHARQEVLAISLAGVIIFIAAGGGTGGGGVLDPIYILVMGLDPKVRTS
jgi:hypothetical protein